MRDAGCFGDQQQMGNRWPIGCVALEITQRCNLDCTLCYLSEHSEAVRDIPLDEIFRRIDGIYHHFGANTDIQITGGEPTLRPRQELIAIISRISALGMRATLMTNGIRARRPLLAELARAGLVDVAFHVDTTQQRNGYASESALNALRTEYIRRAQDLPLSILFNTTVHGGNFADIPNLVKYFTGQAGVVRTASFQLQAETGRGVAAPPDPRITPAAVMRMIERGAGTSINFNASLTGHPSCNRYGMCLEVNGRLFDCFDDPAFIARMQKATTQLVWDRKYPGRTARTFLGWLARHPEHLLPCLRWAGIKLSRIRRELLACRGRINQISFFVHNFMDTRALDQERISACAFKVMTAVGPVSMCLYNAQRDDYILKPIALGRGDARRYWQPLSGELSACADPSARADLAGLPERFLKGRTRRAQLAGICKSCPPSGANATNTR